jgi:hypothetical protein
MILIIVYGMPLFVYSLMYFLKGSPYGKVVFLFLFFNIPVSVVIGYLFGVKVLHGYLMIFLSLYPILSCIELIEYNKKKV